MQITFLEESARSMEVIDPKVGIAYLSNFFASDIFEKLALLDFKVLFDLPQPI